MIKMRALWGMIIALVFLSAGCTTATLDDAETNPFNQTYTKLELEEDFNVLKTSILTEHPKLYTDQEALNNLLVSQYARIEDGMTEREFLKLLSPIVSALNCGHTSIMNSDAYQDQLATDAKYFPLPLRFIEGKAYVVQNAMDSRVPIGAELLSINGSSLQEIREKLFKNLSADGTNETRKDFLLNGWFMYKFYNFIDNAEFFDITYSSEATSEAQTLTIKAATNEEMKDKNKSVYTESEVPYASTFESDYAILSMYSFYPEGEYSISSYKSFIDEFFLQVKGKQIPNVILDVRQNSGGDPLVTSYLLSYLAKTSQPYFSSSALDYYDGLKSDVPLAENRFEGKLYILMSGASFSSTGHLLALLKYQNVGVFIGVESGGSFACTDASKDIVLPNSKIQYRTSTLVWEVAVEGMTPGRGIMPDYTVIQPIEDYLNQKDTVMVLAINKIMNE